MEKKIYERFLYPSLCLCLFGFALAWLASRTNFDIYWNQFALHDLPGAVWWAGMLILAYFLAPYVPMVPVARFIERCGEHSSLFSAAVFLLLAAAAPIVYFDHPLSMDEYSFYFQAKVFAAGHLMGQFPAELVRDLVPPLFHGWFFEISPVTGKIASTYWPGFSLLLTPFMKLGVPWLLNPLLAAGAVFLIGRLTFHFSKSHLLMGWAMWFTVASPAFMGNAVSYYSNVAHLFLNLCFSALLVEPTRRRLVAAGIVGSLALVLHNPYPHTLFALPWLVWLLARPDRVKNLGHLALGYIPLVLLLGVGWFFFRLGIGGSGYGNVVRSVDGTLVNSALADISPRALATYAIPTAEMLKVRFSEFLKVFLWAVPGLPLLALFGYRSWRARGPSRTVLVLAASGVVTFLGYFIVVYHQHNGWGARYFQPAWAVLPIFAALALSEEPVGTRWTKTVAALVFLSLFVGNGVRLNQMRNYLAREIAGRPCLDKDVKQLCFIAFEGTYPLELIQNDPFLRDPRWILFGHGKEADTAVVNRFFPGATLVKESGNSTVWSRP